MAKQRVLLENLERIGHVSAERVLPPLSDAVVARDGHVVATAGDVWCLRGHAEGGGMLETDSGLLDADLCAGGARQGMRRRGAGGPRGRASCRR